MCWKKKSARPTGSWPNTKASWLRGHRTSQYLFRSPPDFCGETARLSRKRHDVSGMWTARFTERQILRRVRSEMAAGRGGRMRHAPFRKYPAPALGRHRQRLGHRAGRLRHDPGDAARLLLLAFTYTVLYFCFLANRLQPERLAERVEQLNAKLHIR
jgi:hypothetical protein